MTMRTSLLLPALLGLMLAACGAQDAPADSAAPAPAAAAEAAPAEQIADEPALDPAAAGPEAEAPADDAAPDEAAAPADAAEATAAGDTAPPAPAARAEPARVPGLVLGTDYEIIRNGQPFEPLAGRIEVVEVFNHVCPACAMFEPLAKGWRARQPADVRFTYVAAPFGGTWDVYARAWYAAESVGIADRASDDVFKALHVDRSLKGERGRDSVDDIARVYARHGIDAKRFASTMESFAVTAKLNRARQYIERMGVNSTPTLIVNGKYRVRGQSWDDMLRNADLLIAHERGAAQ